MAEVRLVLSTDDGIVPPTMAEYDEIMITRRLFRDGESQYEINNIPCRLSDVTDFFMDTGVGRNSYAIIEQGRVDMVVASKPEDGAFSSKKQPVSHATNPERRSH